ncbi:hypothetical protein SFC08_13185 [Lysinibacillus halotolerans]|uniref:DUF6906 domain-containing protein n=1 Tax=Ureibacillus galli TaxID=2762222 RepID=A0ABR8XG22_9BACL|nr:hypothetical protein [Ureibacillus galli]MBD8028187.1 hypothetical protein [Ureibacillus galli]
MKNGKRLKRFEKQYLRSLNLNDENWLLSKKTTEFWLIVHKLTGQTKEIPAP